jgi:hypothetical protein
MLPVEYTPNNITAVVQRGMEMPIRRMEQGEARKAIGRAITAVCSAMGVEAPVIDALTIAVDTVHKRFSTIGANEILTAFQLYADGTLEVKSRFYARFDLKTLGEVLASYIEYRRDTAAAILRARHEAERIQQNAEAEAAKKAEYDKAFPSMLKGFTGEWQDIPPHWYESAIRLGLMAEPDTATKKAVFEKAKEIASNEVAKEAGEHSNIFAYRHALRLLEEGHTVEARAISISKKLVVWQHFFESKNQVQ